MSASKYIQTQAVAISKKAVMNKQNHYDPNKRCCNLNKAIEIQRKLAMVFKQNGTIQTRTVMLQTKDVTVVSKILWSTVQ
jgi:16S rRNA U516 pseudouridylate synthase RsuA-like enzyme